MNFNISYSSHKGKREIQEDGIIKGNINDYYIFGVLDGHGGSGVVDYLSKHLIKKMKTEINDISNVVDIEFFFLNLDDFFIKNKFESGCCLTLIIFNLKKNEIISINIGDCKLVILNKNYNMIFESKDHNLFNQSELKRIKKLEGYKHINLHTHRYKKLLITRVLGDYYCKNIEVERKLDALSAIPEIHIMNFIRNCFFLLMTDGVTNEISLDKLVSLIKNKRKAHDIVKYIISHSNNKYLDNISLIIINNTQTIK